MHDVQTVLEFTITSFGTSDEALEGQLNEAVSETKVVENMNPAPSRVIDGGNVVDGIISTTNNTVIPTMAAWDPLLDKIKLFTEIVDGISEVWFKRRRSPRSSHVHGLLHSRSIRTPRWHGPSCLLRTR
jgi:hypothetical protein